MTFIDSVILGIVQGITEFLPISSSAHLVIIPLFLKRAYQGLTFDVALHLGTLSALLIYFHKDWYMLIKNALLKNEPSDRRFLLYIGLASMPAVIAGLLFETVAETTFRKPLIISMALIIGSIALFASDKKSKLNKTIRDIGIKESLLIGIAQALAIIPGISRSGITIAAGLFSDLKRESAARFSFLLATPIILGAGILRISKTSAIEFNSIFFVGFLSAFVAGIITIDLLLKYLKKANLNVFILYRLLLSLAIILFAL